ncbi:MAG: hypothetical protein AB1393_03420 [Candidatus Edwardsbacteria bacterium]
MAKVLTFEPGFSCVKKCLSKTRSAREGGEKDEYERFNFVGMSCDGFCWNWLLQTAFH